MRLQYIHPSNRDGDVAFIALFDAVTARAVARDWINCVD